MRETGRVFAQVKLSKLKQLPIRVIDFTNATDKGRHDRVVTLAEQTASLQRDIRQARASGEKAVLRRQIATTERHIDRLVYELYGLTQRQIKEVEEAVARLDGSPNS